jgi:hypothetical protein
VDLLGWVGVAVVAGLICAVVAWARWWGRGPSERDLHAMALRDADVDDVAWDPPAVVGGDPTWTPPPVRLDSQGRRTDGEVGSLWRLTHRASVVIPKHYRFAMFALVDPAAIADRYTLEAGTHLRLEVIDNPEDHPGNRDLAMVLYIEFAEGWDYWEMRIEDGPSAGILLTVPSCLDGNSRFPSDICRSSLALERIPDD